MTKLPDIMPISDLRKDTAAAMKRIKAAKRPLIITQRGRAAAVIISVAAYERSERERELLRQLAQGEREMAAGKGYDLESILAEAETFLAAESD